MYSTIVYHTSEAGKERELHIYYTVDLVTNVCHIDTVYNEQNRDITPALLRLQMSELRAGIMPSIMLRLCNLVEEDEYYGRSEEWIAAHD